MRPNSEQIQHAAYDRWQRRGFTHGRDREDWEAAEKELTFLLNYRTIAEYALDSGRRQVLGETSPRRCRFCERASNQVGFGPPRPVVPTALGNRSLFTAEVCDDCREDWQDPLDAEFLAFWESVGNTQGGPRSRPIFSVAAFKSLIAGAMLILPEAELPSVLDTMEWVSNPDHDSDDQLFAGALCQVYSVPFMGDRSWISLARRIDDEAPLPNLIYFLALGGLIVQVPVPLCLHDEDLDGRAVYQPERAQRGFRPRFPGESRDGVAPGGVAEASTDGASVSLDRFVRVIYVRHDGSRRDDRTRGDPGTRCRTPGENDECPGPRRASGRRLLVGLDREPTWARAGRVQGVRLLTLERPFPADGRYPSDTYIGPEACEECHPGESALQARSGHAQTLSPAGRRTLRGN